MRWLLEFEKMNEYTREFIEIYNLEHVCNSIYKNPKNGNLVDVLLFSRSQDVSSSEQSITVLLIYKALENGWDVEYEFSDYPTQPEKRNLSDYIVISSPYLKMAITGFSWRIYAKTLGIYVYFRFDDDMQSLYNTLGALNGDRNALLNLLTNSTSCPVCKDHNRVTKYCPKTGDKMIELWGEHVDALFNV